ncbi:hypothetical protein BCS7_12080 [Pectobacterium odoriferum]|nr:hypothetical protein BCS7_12080 [Pectobacterium odoriferum]
MALIGQANGGRYIGGTAGRREQLFRGIQVHNIKTGVERKAISRTKPLIQSNEAKHASKSCSSRQKARNFHIPIGNIQITYR